MFRFVEDYIFPVSETQFMFQSLSLVLLSNAFNEIPFSVLVVAENAFSVFPFSWL